MIVRELNVSDLEEILKIEESLYVDPWNKQAYLRDLENDIAYNYVLEHDGIIIGYYGFWIMFDNIDITKVSIRKEFQGLGLSHILMNDLFARINNVDIKTITLEVRVSNESAINLYKKHGFKQICIRKNYYGNKEDAYILQKEVNEDA